MKKMRQGKVQGFAKDHLLTYMAQEYECPESSTEAQFFGAQMRNSSHPPYAARVSS
jgi:hypothetical protein